MSDARVEELVEGFEFLDSWDDRFRYIIDLGRKLPPMDEALKNDETKVDGCTSQVWMVASAEGSPLVPPDDRHHCSHDGRVVNSPWRPPAASSQHGPAHRRAG